MRFMSPQRWLAVCWGAFLAAFLMSLLTVLAFGDHSITSWFLLGVTAFGSAESGYAYNRLAMANKIAAGFRFRFHREHEQHKALKDRVNREWRVERGLEPPAIPGSRPPTIARTRPLRGLDV